MGVADKAKAGRNPGDSPPSNMATLTRTLEELERRLARLSASKTPDPASGPALEPAGRPAETVASAPATPAERLRQIVNRTASQAAYVSTRTERIRETTANGDLDDVVNELRALKTQMSAEIAAGTRAGQAAMGSAFATLEATLAARDSSDLIADGLAEILTRLAGLEEGATDSSAIASLHADTKRLRDIVSGLATHEELTRHMGVVNDKLDGIAATTAETLDKTGFADGVTQLADRLNHIETLLANLPETLGIDRLESRLHAIAEKASASVAPSVIGGVVDFAPLEERLDEISGAILALDEKDAAPPAWLEQKLDSLAERIDRNAFPEDRFQQRLDSFIQQLEAIEAQRYQRHAEAFVQELQRLEELWRNADAKASETEANLSAILQNVVDRLTELEAETRGQRRNGDDGGIVFDADFAEWRPDGPETYDEDEIGLRAALDRHLKRRRQAEAAQPQADDDEAAHAPDGATRYGRDVHEFGSILERVRRHERAAGLNPSTRADFIAAARRAAAAAAAEADAAHAANAEHGAQETRSGRYRKPVFMAAGAIMLALMALPFTRMQSNLTGQPTEIAEGERGQDVSQEMTASIPQSAEDGADTATSAQILSRALRALPAGARAGLPASDGLPRHMVDAARNGSAAAMAALGNQLIRQGETEAGLAWLGQAGRRFYAPAQYLLGTFYERGVGVETNMGLARDWYLLAVRAGNVRAMHNLAVMEISGLAGPVNVKEAARLFGMAAERGMRDSQFNLAVMHARGNGVRRNPEEAYRWFAIAARSGDAAAARNRDEIGMELAPDRKQQLDDIAARWQPVMPVRSANEDIISAERV